MEVESAKGGRKPRKHGRKGNGTKGGERSKGAGTLEYRKRKGWLARWTVEGKRYSESIGNVSKAEAEKRLADITAPYRVRDEIQRAEMLQGRVIGARARLAALNEKRPCLRIDTAFDEYEKSPLRPDTSCESRLDIVRGRFGFFVSFMKESYPLITELRQVTQAHVKDFAVSRYCAGKAPSTYNGIISVCKMIFKTLAGDERAGLTENPWQYIKPKHATPVRRRELTTDELRRVCGAVTGEMRILFAIGIYTGLRLGDCVRLDWGNVDMARRLITVTPSKTARKTGQRVTIPIHSALFDILSEMPTEKRRGLVMPELCAKYTKRAPAVVSAIRQVFTQCGIETRAENPNGLKLSCVVGFHSLRHTFVSLAANAGVPLALVQAIVGHSQTEMTRHYFHENEGALMGAVAALPNVIRTESARKESPHLLAFRDLVSAMSNDERRAAMAYLQTLQNAVAVDVKTV